MDMKRSQQEIKALITAVPKLFLQCPKIWSHSEYDTICASQMRFALFFLLFMYLFLVSCLLELSFYLLFPSISRFSLRNDPVMPSLCQDYN